MGEHPGDERERGLFASVRALFDTVVSILHNRTELFATELEEEATRLVQVLVWAVAAVFAALIGVTFLGVMLTLAVPPEHRVLAAAALGVVFLSVSGFGLLAIRRIARAKPRAFDASMREMEKDLDRLRGGR